MNLQCARPLVPLRVLVINPLPRASQLIIQKTLSGRIFGPKQRISLILLVFSVEVSMAETLKLELEKCAFPCTFSIEVCPNVPLITEADIFIFMSNFEDPNTINYSNIVSDEQFDMLYLIVKIANNLEWPKPPQPPPRTIEKPKFKKIWVYEDPPAPIRTIIFADGLVTLDIVRSLSKDIPSDIFFCPSPLPTIARSVLGAHLKVPCRVINKVFAWAGNDENFHIEIEKPMLRNDNSTEGICDWDVIGKDALANLNLDHTQFSASWMKKEFIDKIRQTAQKNPHQTIHRASCLAQTMEVVWSTRTNKTDTVTSIGIISDGSTGTIKDLPYVMPVILSGDSYKVHDRYEEDAHLRREIMQFNKIVKNNHGVLIPYCKKLLNKGEKKLLEEEADNTDTVNSSQW